MMQQQPQGKPIGFKTLEEVSGYISVHDGTVLKIVVSVMKVMKDSAQKAPDSFPLYNIATSVNVVCMTQADYETVTKPDIKE